MALIRVIFFYIILSKFIFLAIPFVLCSCFPQVNPPALTDMPKQPREFNKQEAVEANAQRQNTLNELEQQKQTLLKEEASE